MIGKMMMMIKYILLFVWVELILIFALGCSSPREKRGDWMEHLNHRQFNFNAPTIHWDRHNYYTHEELQQMWKVKYEEAIQNCIDRGADE